MNVLDFLLGLNCLPQSKEGRKTGCPSKSEVKRWCEKGCVLLNGDKVNWRDAVEFPITQLAFFSGDARVTILE